MKIQDATFIQLELDGGVSEWSFIVPNGSIKLYNERDVFKLYVKKAVFKNDWLVIDEGKNMIVLNFVPHYLRYGSPNIMYLIRELNTLRPDMIRFRFDPYDSKIYAKNIHATEIAFIYSGTVGAVLGLDSIHPGLNPGEELAFDREVNLAPPEVVCIKMDGLRTNGLQINSEGAMSDNTLVFIGNEISTYGSVVYRDSEGMFGSFLDRRDLNEIKLYAVNQYGEPIVNNSAMHLILAVEVWREDREDEMIDLLTENVSLAKLGLVANSLRA